MNRLLGIVVIGVLAFSIAACSSDNANDPAVGGALVGGPADAGVGGPTVRHSTRTARAGGAIRPAAGAADDDDAAPSSEEPSPPSSGGGQGCVKRGYDAYGNRICKTN
jgi:hypothetical protein